MNQGNVPFSIFFEIENQEAETTSIQNRQIEVARIVLNQAHISSNFKVSSSNMYKVLKIMKHAVSKGVVPCIVFEYLFRI